MFCDVYVLFSCPLKRLGVGDPARLKHSPEVREIFWQKIEIAMSCLVYLNGHIFKWNIEKGTI